MTLAEAVLNKLQSWKESISSSTETEQDEKDRETYVSASCSLVNWELGFTFTLGDF